VEARPRKVMERVGMSGKQNLDNLIRKEINVSGID
jgi:hypothetical protein